MDQPTEHEKKIKSVSNYDVLFPQYTERYVKDDHEGSWRNVINSSCTRSM